VSIELDAPAGHDRQLLSLGLGVERVLGVMAGPPATHKKSASS
jgi:hypothetical protein